MPRIAPRRRVYLDYAASTPVLPEALRAMRPYFTEKFGNPGSLHSFGQEALAAVDRARETVAAALEADFREVVFTGSATEANNLALRGAVAAWRRAASSASVVAAAAPVPHAPAPRVIISTIEHESVLETAATLERDGVEVVRLPVDRKGIVKLDALEAALGPHTAIVSLMYANNETGAVQPIAKAATLVREFRARQAFGTLPGPLFHTDAAQAFQFLDCRPASLGADLVTLSAHKIYGPKGIGALYIGKAKIEPIVTGGGQEFGLRSGTESPALTAGFAAAVLAGPAARRERERHFRRMEALKEKLVRGLRAIDPRVRVNGPADALPHIVNFRMPGLQAEDALVRLDLKGVAVAAGSACAARSSEPSHVLRAMGLSPRELGESLRISMGRPTTAAELSLFLNALRQIRRGRA